jgi:hypothetical protein
MCRRPIHWGFLNGVRTTCGNRVGGIKKVVLYDNLIFPVNFRDGDTLDCANSEIRIRRM